MLSYFLLYLRTRMCHPSWWFLNTFCLRLGNEDLLLSWGLKWTCLSVSVKEKGLQNSTCLKFLDKVQVLSDSRNSLYWQILARKIEWSKEKLYRILVGCWAIFSASELFLCVKSTLERAEGRKPAVYKGSLLEEDCQNTFCRCLWGLLFFHDQCS